MIRLAIFLCCVLSLLNASLALMAITFAAGQPRDPQITYISMPGGTGDIYLLNISRVLSIQLTRDRANEWGVDWSPAGDRIVYVSNATGFLHLYVRDLSSGRIRQMTHGSYSDLNPAWSPDGQYIAFASNRSGIWRIYTLDTVCLDDGSDCQEAQTPVGDTPDWRTTPGAPDWAADGRLAWAQLTENGLYSIFITNSARRVVHRLTGPLMAEWPITWSPDGRQIAFTAVTDGNQEVYVVDSETGDLTNLSRSDRFDGLPAWSPDSSAIAFTSSRTGVMEIFLVDRDGGPPRQFTYHGGRSTYPAWSPDGRWLTYEIGARSTTSQLVLTDLTGADFRALTPGVTSQSAVWGP